LNKALQYRYTVCCRYDNHFFRTDNCKAVTPVWIELTDLLPEDGGINDVECDPYNPDMVYISQNNKIYKSTDRGLTWVNISGTLPEWHIQV